VSPLLRRPARGAGKVHDITPADAGWSYVGFGLYRLKPGDRAAEPTRGREAILVLVEGRARVSGGGQDFGELGDRLSVWDKTPPHSVYVPDGADWAAVAVTDCTLAVCTAPGQGGHEAQVIGPA
jgi:5-deoxy-glucuronate isomerase